MGNGLFTCNAIGTVTILYCIFRKYKRGPLKKGEMNGLTFYLFYERNGKKNNEDEEEQGNGVICAIFEVSLF